MHKKREIFRRNLQKMYIA